MWAKKNDVPDRERLGVVCFCFMVGTTELESVTSCLSSRRSNQLSYAPVNVVPAGWTAASINITILPNGGFAVNEDV